VAEPIRTFVILDAGVNRDDVERALPGTGEVEIVGIVEGIDEAWVRLHETSNDLLVLAVQGQSELALQLIDRAVRERPRRPVVVLGYGSPDGFTRRVFAAGADDMILLPAAPDEVMFAFQKALARKAGGVESATFSRAPLICVLGPKGGTGKTLTATSLSVALAELGKSVVLIDLDLQFGDVGLCMGVAPEKTIFDLVRTGGSLDEEKVNGFLLTHSSGVKLLLAPARPDQAAVVSVDFLRELYATLRLMVDFVIVDTPPGFTPEVIATIDSASAICMIGMLDALSLKNTKLGLETLELMGFPRENIKLILNRAGSRVGISEAEVVAIMGREPDILIPSDRDIPRSVNEGMPILLARPQSEASQAFRKLASQFVQVDELPSPHTVRASRTNLWRRIGLRV